MKIRLKKHLLLIDRKKSTRSSITQCLQLGLLSVICLGSNLKEAAALDGSWSANSSTNWSVSGSWSGGTIANGAGFTATFSNNINGNRVITLDSARTIGNIVIGDTITDSNTFTISGGNLLTLDNNGSASTISKSVSTNARNDTISVPIQLNNDLNITNTATSSSGRISVTGSISESGGSRSITISTSTGRVILGGQSTFTGGVTLNAGTLSIDPGTPVNTTPVSGTVLSGPLGRGTLTINGGTFITSSGGSNEIGNAILLNSFASNSITAGGNTTLHGVISGAGGFRKGGGGPLTLTGANTYTGKTIVGGDNGATGLAVSSFNSVNGGMPLLASSSLGAPTTVENGTIDLGEASSGTNPTAITYNGTGETTDRVINLASTTGALTISQSGSGTLKFTSNFTATGAGAKTLTLSGSTVGVGEIAGAVVDNDSTNTTTINKTGLGVWILSGNNTYTGTTTVTAGVLGFGKKNSLYGGDTLKWTDTNLTVNSGATAVFAVGGASDFSLSDFLTLSTLGTATGGFKDGSFIGIDTTNSINNEDQTISNAFANSNGGMNKLGLVKSGTNKLILEAANTHTGPTTVVGGTLNLKNELALQYSTLSSTAGTVEFDQAVTSNAFTVGALSGSGGIALVNNAGVPAAVALTIGNNSNNNTYSGVLSGSGSVIKVNSATQTLSGQSTYSGGTTLNGGTIAIGASSTPTIGALTSGPIGTGMLTMNGGTKLTGTGNFEIGNAVLVNGSVTMETTGSSSFVVNGPLTNTSSGDVITLGTNNGVVSFNGDNSGFTGTFMVNSTAGNTLTLSGTTAASQDASNAKFVLSGSTSGSNRPFRFSNVNNDTVKLGSLSGSGFINHNGDATNYVLEVGNLGLNDEFAGSFTSGASSIMNLRKVGTGSLTLSGTAAYLGDTTVSSGTLIAGVDAVSTAISSVTIPDTDVSVANDSFTLAGHGLVDGDRLTFISTRPGGINSTTFYYVVNSDANTFKVSLTSGGAAANITSASTATFHQAGAFGSNDTPIGLGDGAGANATLLAGYHSNPTVTIERSVNVAAGAGTRTLGSTQDGNSVYSGAIALNKNLSITSASTGGNALLISGAITGSGFGIDKVGPGKAVLSGMNTYTGDTTVTEGILSLTTDDVLADAADVYIANGAILDLTFSGQDDVRSLYLNGVLQTPGLYGASGLGSSFFTGAGLLNVLGALQGDFDGDGDVDGADFIVWQTNYPITSGATLGQGDADGDTDVDGADFAAWQNSFPTSPGPGSSPVPEPGAIVLAGIGLAALCVRIRRKR